MTRCNNCAQEFAGGPSCPYCGAPNVPATHTYVPGSAVDLRPGRAISATHIIVGINVLVFVAMVVTGGSFINPSREQLLRWGANWGYPCQPSYGSACGGPRNWKRSRYLATSPREKPSPR